MTENSLVNKKIQEYFKIDKLSAKQSFDALTLYIYSLQSNQNDLYLLAKILPESSISELVSYYDGDYLRIPSKDDYKVARLVALSFFLKEIEKWSWPNIKDFLSLAEEDADQFNTVSLGIKIKQVKDKMNKDLLNLLNKVNDSNLESKIQEYANE